MAFWGKALKADLQKLAKNLWVEVEASATVIEIKKTIQAIPNYDEEVDYIKELLETLKAVLKKKRRSSKEKRSRLQQKEKINGLQ
ncbi:hypothetical protein AVEN_212758-1 [Araneus ventricosus]|uniref:Uncharacterized protein n=1 Tax=Araneus ventricosus TaxID=182803 RepID=A0A4Y2TH43_ARAVE|nr:hypothetical protein AVEN_212758-1 [Araneus ventricosus]